MKLTKCSNEHYYDADKYSVCPHCNPNAQSVDDSVTVSMTTSHDMMTEKFDQEKTVTLSEVVEEASTSMGISSPDDDLKTISFYSEQTGTEPVVGWLVAVSGKHLGESFSLKSGRNFVGRSSSMDVVLNGDNSVSRERHAIIIYEPKARVFFAQPGESRELFYVNDEVVLSNIMIQTNDTFLIGNTKLKFIPFCSKEFAWEDIEKEGVK